MLRTAIEKSGGENAKCDESMKARNTSAMNCDIFKLQFQKKIIFR